MLAAIGLMACPNLAVPAEVMRHVVEVESGANPYAIGVVGGQLARQPKNLAEALATVHMLDAKGYNYSLGVAQVNRANLDKYGLDSYEKAFEPCPNLAAGAQILAACHASSGGDWGKAFSCYYSGNFTTGYRDGYGQKVFDSFNRTTGMTANTDASQAIPLRPTSQVAPGGARKAASLIPDSPGYRVAIRSVAFYTTTTAAVPANGAASNHTPASHDSVAQAPPNPALTSPASVKPSTPASKPASGATSVSTTSSVFVPQVTGPNDPPPQSTPVGDTASTQVASASLGTSGSPVIPGQEHRDAAFVF